LRRDRFRLPAPGACDERSEGRFRSLVASLGCVRTVFALGDERRRRFAKQVVPVRPLLFREPDRSFVSGGVIFARIWMSAPAPTGSDETKRICAVIGLDLPTRS